MANRVTFWGAAITGFMGWVFAINAILSGEYIGSGVILIGSAVAFGVVGAYSRKS